MAKKNTKRGFTLVELIVVLVILAILAALLIPALTGYIDKARKSQVVAETRMLTQAVQTEMSTLYASNEYATQLNAITIRTQDSFHSTQGKMENQYMNTNKNCRILQTDIMLLLIFRRSLASQKVRAHFLRLQTIIANLSGWFIKTEKDITVSTVKQTAR